MLPFGVIVMLECFSVVAAETSNTIYQFVARDANDNDVSLEKYRNKVVLIVNVASQCGLTNTNYAGLKALYDKYQASGLRIAAFPCNQFAGQEPGSENEIREFVRDTFGFEPDLYAKIDVNGSNEHPLYTFLKEQQSGSLTDAIKWNFIKFLVNKRGEVVARYAPTTHPVDIEKEIISLLEEHDEL